MPVPVCGPVGWVPRSAAAAGRQVPAASTQQATGTPCSECWRAPAAVMVREVSPVGLGSTASAAHLCIRNLVGGLGPIAVALLSAKVRAGVWVCVLLGQGLDALGAASIATLHQAALHGAGGPPTGHAAGASMLPGVRRGPGGD